ncbi:MAG: hypothetical protein ABI600_16885 [Luteolibacter sp.]
MKGRVALVSFLISTLSVAFSQRDTVGISRPVYTPYETDSTADGVANLLECAFNMLGGGIGQVTIPTTANNSVPFSASIASLPSSGIEIGTGKLTISCIRRKLSSMRVYSITSPVQFSYALVLWSVNAAVSESVISFTGIF